MTPPLPKKRRNNCTVKNNDNIIGRYSNRSGGCCVNQWKAEQCTGILFYFHISLPVYVKPF